jgi:Ca2+/H+ antiporter, TMEM165/GDT1 family
MDALLSAFIAAGLAEWGDRTQWLVILLAARSGRPGQVILALLAAAAISNGVAAYAGGFVADIITVQATTLLLALALLFAGVAGLIRRGPPSPGSSRVPVLLAAVILLLAAELGDRTQFLAFGFAARFDAPVLAAAGATAGILAAGIPAALLAERLRPALERREIRLGIAGLFLLAGAVVGLGGLQA